MRKLISAVAASLLLLGGCSKQDKGIGVVPLEGVALQGKVVEAGESGVLLRTNGKRDALLPDDWTYQQNGKSVQAADLSPGTPVTAVAPNQSGRLVASSGKNLVLASGDDTFTLPVEAFPQESRQMPVQVQTYGGQTQMLPLQDAVYSPEYTVMSHPSYSGYSFPVAEPHSLSRAYMIGQYDQAPLALVPNQDYLQVMSLPPSHYPVQSLGSNQPVRFSYYDNDVAVTSWDSLTDGEIGLSEVLLAGTLLDVLPGQAVVEVGSRPFVVPRNFVYNNGRPVAWNSVRPGAPIDVQYYPGVYQVVDYSNDYFTLSYNDTIVQLPVDHVPDRFYNQPIAVYQNQNLRRLPYGQAKKLLRNNQAQIYAAPVGANYWNQWQQLDNRHMRRLPGYENYVVYNQSGIARVAPRGQKFNKKRHRNVYFGAADSRARHLDKSRHNRKAWKKHQKSAWTHSPKIKKQHRKAWKGHSKVRAQAPRYRQASHKKRWDGNKARKNVLRKGSQRASYQQPRAVKQNKKHRVNRSRAVQNAPRRWSKPKQQRSFKQSNRAATSRRAAAVSRQPRGGHKAAKRDSSHRKGGGKHRGGKKR